MISKIFIGPKKLGPQKVFEWVIFEGGEEILRHGKEKGRYGEMGTTAYWYSQEI